MIFIKRKGGKPTLTIAPNSLERLRAVIPPGHLTYGQALEAAESQAALLLDILGIHEAPVDVFRVAELPGITVRTEPRHRMTCLSGYSQGASDDTWEIVVNRNDVSGRRRFTLAHEIKHVLDDPIAAERYAAIGFGNDEERQQQIEQICNHFAASLLMPQGVLKRLWEFGIRDVETLARDFFRVSPAAMRVRLRYLGFEPQEHRDVSTYFRRVSDRHMLAMTPNSRAFYFRRTPAAPGASDAARNDSSTPKHLAGIALSDAEIDDFKVIYTQVTGKDINGATARDMGTRLMLFVHALARPPEQGDSVNQQDSSHGSLKAR